MTGHGILGSILLFASATFPLLTLQSGLLAQPQPNCKSPQTQLDMNLCEGQRAQAADRTLNQVYQQVRAKYRGTPQADKLVDAQLAWIAFRDQECQFSAARFEGGSIAPMVKSGCVAQLTIARTKDLRTYLKNN
jgi:uncharacterized protein YecT (DUF1311 family)